jgi:hypothetical protein
VILPRELSAKSTGLLRRGEDELLVAELTAVSLLDDTTRVVSSSSTCSVLVSGTASTSISERIGIFHR